LNNENLFVNIFPNNKDQIINNDNVLNFKVSSPKALKVEDKNLIGLNDGKNNIFNVAEDQNLKYNLPKLQSNTILNTKSETK